MSDRIFLYRIEMISDRWEDIPKGDTLSAVKVNERSFMGFADGHHFFIPAKDVRVVAQLYPPARTGMQLVEDELGKVK